MKTLKICIHITLPSPYKMLLIRLQSLRYVGATLTRSNAAIWLLCMQHRYVCDITGIVFIETLSWLCSFHDRLYMAWPKGSHNLLHNGLNFLVWEVINLGSILAHHLAAMSPQCYTIRKNVCIFCSYFTYSNRFQHWASCMGRCSRKVLKNMGNAVHVKYLSSNWALIHCKLRLGSVKIKKCLLRQYNMIRIIRQFRITVIFIKS